MTLMKFIAHRINTIEQLRQVPQSYGVELDARDHTNGQIYLQHEPFMDGEDFEEYLKEYHHGTMIVNVKSERIEHKVTELLERYHVDDYFFLDSSFPMIKLLTDMGERKIALRYSELEGMDTLRNMAGRVDWVWVDCFTRMPLTKEDFLELKGLGYKLCLVSPDLVGRADEAEAYRRQLEDMGIVFDAVCAKLYHADVWERRGTEDEMHE